MAKGQQRSNKEVRKPKGQRSEEDQCVQPVEKAGWDSKRMKIEGNIRSNLISTISAVRRWRGQPVHRDTVNYWHGVLEQGRRASILSFGEPTADLVAELEQELAITSRAKPHLP